MNTSIQQTQPADLTALAQKVIELDQQGLSACDEPLLSALVELGDQAQQIVAMQQTLKDLTKVLTALDQRYSHFDVNGVECDEDYPQFKRAAQVFVATGQTPADLPA